MPPERNDDVSWHRLRMNKEISVDGDDGGTRPHHATNPHPNSLLHLLNSINTVLYPKFILFLVSTFVETSFPTIVFLIRALIKGIFILIIML